MRRSTTMTRRLYALSPFARKLARDAGCTLAFVTLFCLTLGPFNSTAVVPIYPVMDDVTFSTPSDALANAPTIAAFLAVAFSALVAANFALIRRLRFRRCKFASLQRGAWRGD